MFYVANDRTVINKRNRLSNNYGRNMKNKLALFKPEIYLYISCSKAELHDTQLTEN